MLVRRFTIVCLLMTLFGMLFAILVAEGRQGRSWANGVVTPCVFEGGRSCLAPTRK